MPSGSPPVDNFRDVDPKIGTLADFDEMVSTLHAAGLKLIVDVVPNHTSNLHVWFQEALESAPGSAARDRYIFRDGLGEKGELPPGRLDLHLRWPGLGAGGRRPVVPA